MTPSKNLNLPPGPKPGFPLEHLFAFRRDSIGFLGKIAKEYGDIVRFRIGPMQIILLNHPDYIKEVLTVQHQNFVKGRPLQMAKQLLGEGLLTSEGDFHKRQSRMIQPAFHRAMIESYVTPITKSVTDHIHSWQNAMQVDMKDEMTTMSLAIAANALFGVNLDKEAPGITRALDTATDLFGRISLPFSEWLLHIPLPATIRFKRAKRLLNNTVRNIIEDRRRNAAAKEDLLSIMLRCQAGTNGNGEMSDQQIRDEALTLLLTAFDTTSVALTWAWYLLSQNPGVEAELHEELDRVLQGRLPTLGDVGHLKYTRLVFGESMRIFPPSYVIPREAANNCKIGGFDVPRGSLILMSPYLIHHDARFHPHPEEFDPYAWERHTLSKNAKYEYLPFSRGPRSCIGESFAWMQGILVLATVAQTWKLKLVPGYKVELLQRINLRPKNGMIMSIHRRHAQ